MKIYLFVALLITTSLLGGCGAPEVQMADDNYVIKEESDLSNSQILKRDLYEQYAKWRGTRYRAGGLNRNGIDCSGFIYITFKYRFGIVLPRTAEEMAELGMDVTKGEWRTGDLLFFKTGLFDRHVGVYIEQGQFLHASSSQGVIISELNNPYWHSTYWKAKRVI